MIRREVKSYRLKVVREARRARGYLPKGKRCRNCERLVSADDFRSTRVCAYDNAIVQLDAVCNKWRPKSG